MGGKFTMGDDSHGISQIGTNYGRGAAYLESLGVDSVWTFDRQPHPGLADPTTRAALTDKPVPTKVFRELFKP